MFLSRSCRIILNSFHTYQSVNKGKMELHNVVSVFNKLAPKQLAESWDNVGLLVEPSPPHQVQRLLLTNDLTVTVLEEAIENQANMIVSYHPPIFRPLKTITCSSWKERIIVKCIENRIAVYSPHTSFDAVLGGVNDWILEPFDVAEIRPIQQSFASLQKDGYTHVVNLDVTNNSRVVEILSSLENIQIRLIGCDSEKSMINVYCNEDFLSAVLKLVQENCQEPSAVHILKYETPPVPGYGLGRRCQLKVPLTVQQAINIVKKHLGIRFVRVAMHHKQNLESSISTIATCAGSGASILRGVDADLYLTGEMSHHEVLDAVHRGKVVVLCEHSNTERGFLKKLSGQLKDLLPSVQIFVSETDKDPLTVV